MRLALLLLSALVLLAIFGGTADARKRSMNSCYRRMRSSYSRLKSLSKSRNRRAAAMSGRGARHRWASKMKARQVKRAASRYRATTVRRVSRTVVRRSRLVSRAKVRRVAKRSSYSRCRLARSRFVSCTRRLYTRCPTGYKRSGSVCYRVYCPKPYVRRGAKCVRYRRVVSRRMACPRGFTRYGSRCVQRLGLTCAAGYRVYKGRCHLVRCPAGFTKIGNSCRKSCRKGFTLRGSTCVRLRYRCPKNYFRSGSRCVRYRSGRAKCRAGYKRRGSKCVRTLKSCPLYYKLRGSRCVLTCPSGRVPRRAKDGRVRCVVVLSRCPVGYKMKRIKTRRGYKIQCTMNSSSCAKGFRKVRRYKRGYACVRIACPKNYVKRGSSCVYRYKLRRRCPSGYTRMGAACKRIRCPDGYVRRGSRCVSVRCPGGYRRAGRMCVRTRFVESCPSGWTRHGKLCRRLICPAGYRKVGQYCMNDSCPSGYVRKRRMCVRSHCTAGYKKKGNICVRDCPKGTKTSGRFCIKLRCPKDFRRVGKSCVRVKCPSGYAMRKIRKKVYTGRKVTGSVKKCSCIGSKTDKKPSIKNSIDMAFVVDVTGSMGSVISAIKARILEVINANARSQVVDKFVLVPYTDPKVGPVTVTQARTRASVSSLIRAVNSMRASGGGDCAEYSISGLYEALRRVKDNSIVYLFTDASPSARDRRKESDVKTLAKRKNVQMNFLLTGNLCGKRDSYRSLSEATRGAWIRMSRSQTSRVMSFLSRALTKGATALRGLNRDGLSTYVSRRGKCSCRQVPRVSARYSYVNSVRCVEKKSVKCGRGYRVLKGKCVRIARKCRRGYSLIGGKCVKRARRCRQGYSLIRGKCVKRARRCRRGYSLVKGKCVAVKVGVPCGTFRCTGGMSCLKKYRYDARVRSAARKAYSARLTSALRWYNAKKSAEARRHQLILKNTSPRGSTNKLSRFCEHQAGTIVCPRGTTIDIASGFYGRVSNKYCTRGPRRTTSCSARNALSRIRSVCQNRQYCRLKASNSVFGDPCVGTLKYAEIRYSCKASRATQAAQKAEKARYAAALRALSKNYSQMKDKINVSLKRLNSVVSRCAFEAPKKDGCKTIKCGRGSRCVVRRRRFAGRMAYKPTCVRVPPNALCDRIKCGRGRRCVIKKTKRRIGTRVRTITSAKCQPKNDLCSTVKCSSGSRCRVVYRFKTVVRKVRRRQKRCSCREGSASKPSRAGAGGAAVDMAFVIDTTGSMGRVIRSIQTNIIKIVQANKGTVSQFVVAPFNDPKIGPITVSNKARSIVSAVKRLRARGGGDCPERAMSGILAAARRVKRGSVIYVFTDASANDYRLQPQVRKIVDRKNLQMIFIVTGRLCGRNYHKEYQALSKGNGRVVTLNSRKVDKVLSFIRRAVALGSTRLRSMNVSDLGSYIGKCKCKNVTRVVKRTYRQYRRVATCTKRAPGDCKTRKCSKGFKCVAMKTRSIPSKTITRCVRSGDLCNNIKCRKGYKCKVKNFGRVYTRRGRRHRLVRFSAGCVKINDDLCARIRCGRFRRCVVSNRYSRAYRASSAKRYKQMVARSTAEYQRQKAAANRRYAARLKALSKIKRRISVERQRKQIVSQKKSYLAYLDRLYKRKRAQLKKALHRSKRMTARCVGPRPKKNPCSRVKCRSGSTCIAKTNSRGRMTTKCVATKDLCSSKKCSRGTRCIVRNVVTSDGRKYRAVRRRLSQKYNRTRRTLRKNYRAAYRSAKSRLSRAINSYKKALSKAKRSRKTSSVRALKASLRSQRRRARNNLRQLTRGYVSRVRKLRLRYKRDARRISKIYKKRQLMKKVAQCKADPCARAKCESGYSCYVVRRFTRGFSSYTKQRRMLMKDYFERVRSIRSAYIKRSRASRSNRRASYKKYKRESRKARITVSAKLKALKAKYQAALKDRIKEVARCIPKAQKTCHRVKCSAGTRCIVKRVPTWWYKLYRTSVKRAYLKFKTRLRSVVSRISHRRRYRKRHGASRRRSGQRNVRRARNRRRLSNLRLRLRGKKRTRRVRRTRSRGKKRTRRVRRTRSRGKRRTRRVRRTRSRGKKRTRRVRRTRSRGKKRSKRLRRGTRLSRRRTKSKTKQRRIKKVKSRLWGKYKKVVRRNRRKFRASLSKISARRWKKYSHTKQKARASVFRRIQKESKAYARRVGILKQWFAKRMKVYKKGMASVHKKSGAQRKAAKAKLIKFYKQTMALYRQRLTRATRMYYKRRSSILKKLEKRLSAARGKTRKLRSQRFVRRAICVPVNPCSAKRCSRGSICRVRQVRVGKSRRFRKIARCEMQDPCKTVRCSRSSRCVVKRTPTKELLAYRWYARKSARRHNAALKRLRTRMQRRVRNHRRRAVKHHKRRVRRVHRRLRGRRRSRRIKSLNRSLIRRLRRYKKRAYRDYSRRNSTLKRRLRQNLRRHFRRFLRRHQKYNVKAVCVKVERNPCSRKRCPSGSRCIVRRQRPANYRQYLAIRRRYLRLYRRSRSRKTRRVRAAFTRKLRQLRVSYKKRGAFKFELLAKCAKRSYCPRGYSRSGRACIKYVEVCPESYTRIRTRRGFRCIRFYRICPAGYMLFDDHCVKSCPAGTRPTSKGFCEVVKSCPDFLYNTSCVKSCPKNTVAIGRKCKKCPSSAAVRKGKCIVRRINCRSGFQHREDCVKSCPKGFYAFGSRCTRVRCPPGSKTRFSHRKRRVTCVRNSSCKKGQVFYAGSCRAKCPSGTEQRSWYCLRRCPSGTVRVGFRRQRCIRPYCRHRFRLGRRGCVRKCPVGYVGVRRTCKRIRLACPKGYVRLGRALCLKDCPIGFAKRNGRCEYSICSAGTFRFRGTCMKSCPSGTIRRGRHCYRKSKCKRGRYDYRNLCLTNCPPGHYRSYSTRTCARVKRCAKGMIRFRRLCLKSCPLGFVRARRTCKRRTTCRDGFVYKGACLPSGSGCPRNTVLIRGSCVPARGLCSHGRFLLISSRGARSCVRLCPRGYSADRRRGTCTMLHCPAKMYLYRNTCRGTCPKGFRANSKRQCVRNEKSIKCSGKSFKFSGRCVTSCPAGFALRALKRRRKTIRYCRRSKVCRKGLVLVYSRQKAGTRKTFRYRPKCVSSKKACKRGYKLRRRVVRFMRLGRRVRRVLRVCTRFRDTCAKGLFKYRGSCRKDCPKNMKSVIVRRKSRITRTCAPSCGKKFAIGSKCVLKCPSGYRGIRFGRIKICNRPCKKSEFSFRGKCVRRCPSGFSKRTLRIYSRRSKRVISRVRCQRRKCRRGYRLVYKLRRTGKARGLKMKGICQRIKTKRCRHPKALFYGRCRRACPSGYFRRTRTVRGRRYGFCFATKSTVLCRRKRCKSDQVCVVYRKSRIFGVIKKAFRRSVQRAMCVPRYCKAGTYRYKNRCIKRCPSGYSMKTYKRTRLHKGRKHIVTLRRCTRKACKYPLSRYNARCVKNCPKSYTKKVFNIRFRYKKTSYIRRYAVCMEDLCTRVRCASGDKCIVKNVMAGRRRTKKVAACVRNEVDPCSRMRCRKGYECKSVLTRSGRRRARCVRRAPSCRGGLVVFRRRCRRRCPKRYRVISQRIGKKLQRKCVRDACSKGRYFLFDRCTRRCPIGMASRTKFYSRSYSFRYCQPRRCKGRRFRIGRRCLRFCPAGYRRRYYRTRRGVSRYCLSYICRRGYYKLGRRCVRKCGKNYRLRTYTRGKRTFGVCEPTKCRKGFVFIVGKCRRALKGCYDRAYTCKAMARRKRCGSKLVSYLCPVACGKCNPSKRKFCTCTSSGDPHYRTFDGKWISFQGKCKYLLAQSKLKKGSKCNFQVTAKNEGRGRKGKVSWTRFVDITFHGIRVRLHQRRRVFINGKRVRRLPISLYPEGKKIRIYHSGRNVVAESKYCGMHLQFNGQSVAELHLPRSRYANKVQGICGNCNGNPNDDLKTREGKDVTKLGIQGFAKIGQSFAVPDDSSKKYRCKVKAVPPTTKVCSPAMMKAVKSKKYCGMILDKSGPFGSCIRSKKVDVKGLFANCRFDVCEYKSQRNRRRAVCESMESLYNACLAAGFSVNWRSPSFCPMRCGPNAVYRQKASGCPRTCSDIGRRRVCRLPDRDACVCKPGFVLNGRTCVPEKSCGAVVPIDVAFVLEGTDDINTEEFDALKSLVVKLLTKYRLSLESVRPSMAVFGRISPSVSLFSEHQGKAEFMDYVRNLKKTGGSADNLEAALRVVNKVLMQAIGGFRPQVPKYVIVLKKSSVPANTDKSVRNQLDKLKESKVRVIVVNLPRTGKSSVDPTLSGLTVIAARMPPFTSIPAITKELEATAGCPVGFRMLKDECIDINECQSVVPACHSDATCVNLPGSFVCLCGDGLLHDRARGCVKPEKPKADCPVKPKCEKGYAYDNNAKKCTDINECKDNPCISERAKCKNLEGSFRCECPVGFEYNKYFGCVDVDECKVKSDPCKGAGKCVNILGSYNCTCDSGFTYLSGVGCQDNDECASNATNNCKGGSRCVNTPGSYNCSCGKGYRYVGESCVDIDECAENSKLCDASAMCVNQKPGYKCQCKLGNNWVYKAGDGCVPDQSKGMTDRKVDFIFLIDASDRLKESIRDIQGFINGLLQQFNTKEVAGLSARVTAILMGKKGEANVAFSQSSLVGIADKINSLTPLGGEANLLQGMKTVASEKSKARRESTVIVFLITGSEIKPADGSLAEIKRFSDNFKSAGKFFTIQISPMSNAAQWAVLYTSDEISLFVTVIRSSEVIKIFKLFYLRVYPLINCPAGFVKNDGLCQLQTSTVRYCKTDTGELRPLGTTWQEECSQFKCTESGVQVLFRKCLGYDGFCYSTEEYFPCTQVTGSLNWKCRCRLRSVTDKVTGKAIQSLAYQSIAAANETMMTDKGLACVFPFKYQNRWHYSCAQYEGRYWCSFNRNHQTGNWGYCKIKASTNRCTDPFDAKKIYVEGDRWNYGCNVMECTHTGLRRIPKCEAADKTCKNLHADGYSCRIGDKQHSNCLCVQDSSGWGKNEIVSGDKATVITSSGGAVVSMCVDISSGKKYDQGQQWTTSCFTYKCTATGGQLMQARCQQKDGTCRNIGDKGFDCMISDMARANCECSKDASGNPMLVARSTFEGRIITEIHRKKEVSTSLKMIAQSAKKTITSSNSTLSVSSSSSASSAGSK